MNSSDKVGFLRARHPSDLRVIQGLAEIIWKEHYTPIIGEDQVSYMLAKFQSTDAMREQLGEGYRYFTLILGKEPVGYLAFIKREEELFLSKIYVLKEHRGKQIGKMAMEFVRKQGLELGCSRISLTVNKNNKNSLLAYEHMGFINEGPVVMDIGNGFVMDDYRMSKALRSVG